MLQTRRMQFSTAWLMVIMPNKWKERRATRGAVGIRDHVMHRRHKRLPKLPRWQNRRNDLIARCRAPVEAVLFAMKCIYGKRAPYATARRAMPPTSSSRPPSTTGAAQPSSRREPQPDDSLSQKTHKSATKAAKHPLKTPSDQRFAGKSKGNREQSEGAECRESPWDFAPSYA